MISLILPTVREVNAVECIGAIIRAAEGVDYEIVMVTDKLFSLSTGFGCKIKNIIRPRAGVVDANLKGFEMCAGDYVMTLSDEALLQPFALWELEHLCKFHKDRVLTSPRHLPFYNFKYYDKWFAPFPFAHRSVIKELGGLFLPEYKCFYADPDLSLRAYAAGIEVKECYDAVIVHTNMMNDEAHKFNVTAYTETDREVFKKKWAHLGEFKDP